MMDNTASDITNLVNSSIERLTELGEEMKENQYGDKSVDTSGIQLIIEALRELDIERLRSHELLEVETIKASNLRFKLGRFPWEIKQEITDAVNSARNSNESNTKMLQDQLTKIEHSIKTNEQRLQELAELNSILEPERNDMQLGHDEIIAVLNQKMADKASKQITLNETRDKLRETYKKILDLEDAMVQLQEDLVQEKEDAEVEKEKLREAIADTQKKVEEQRRTNLYKRREIEKFQEELVDSESVLDSKRKAIRKFETSRSRLAAQEVQLNRQLQKEIRDNAFLTQEGMTIVKEHKAMEEKLDEIQNNLREKVGELKGELNKAKQKNEQLLQKKNTLTRDLQDAEEIKDADAIVVAEAETNLQNFKSELKTISDECGRLKEEDSNLEEQIKQLEDSHESSVQIYNREIDEYKAQLGSDRKERTLLQSKRDVSNKESNDFKSDYGKFMAQVSKKLADGKAEHQRLTEYGAQLQKDLKTDESTIVEMQKELKKAKQDYSNLQKELKEEIKNLTSDVGRLTKETEKKKEIIEDRTPLFVDLEQRFKTRSTDFDKLKRSIVDQKNKKASLETSVDRAQKEVKRMEGPQNKLRDELKTMRIKSLELLRKQAESTKTVEQDIFISGQKLGAVLKENHRFKEAIKKLEAEIRSIESQKKVNLTTREIIEKQLVKYRESLEEKWREDFALDKVYAERDILVLKDIDKVQKETKDREERIDEVHVQLENQLHELARFVDRVANLRPTDTRQSQRNVEKKSTADIAKTKNQDSSSKLTKKEENHSGIKVDDASFEDR